MLDHARIYRIRRGLADFHKNGSEKLRRLVLLWNSNSDQSDDVETELNFAKDYNTKIVSIQLEAIPQDYNLKYFIWKKQWISADSAPFASLIENVVAELATVLPKASNVNTPTLRTQLAETPSAKAASSEANGKLKSALMSQGRYKATAILDAIRSGATNFALTDQKGRTALYWAVRQGDAEAVQIALSNGAQPDARDQDGETPLDVARANGFTEIVALLAPNSQPQKPTATQAPPCGNAQTPAQTPATRAVNKANKQLQSAMMSQGRYKAGAILSAIHGGATDFSITDQRGRIPLHWAVREHDAEAVQIALNNGAKANARDNNGETPLDIARANDLTEIIALLAPNDQSLKPKPTTVSAVSGDVKVPSPKPSVETKAAPTFDVFVSHSSKDIEQAELLWKALEKQGHTCWIAPESILPSEQWPVAIRRGVSQSRILVLLFSANSDQSDEVETEIYYAKKKFDVPVVPIRIEDVEPERLEHFIWNAQWISAISPALGQQLPNVVGQIEKVLQKQPTKVEPIIEPVIVNPPVIAPVQPSQANEQLQAALMSKGPLKWNNILSALGDATDFSVKDQAGRTVLHWATMKNDIRAARIAVVGGVDVSAKSDLGKTALDLAKESGAKKIAALLKAPVISPVIVEPEPPVSAANTQLQAALSSKGPRKAKDILDAIRGGATDFSLTDQSGRTALHWAARENDVEAARLALTGGVDADVRSDLGQTALELARASGSAEVVKFLSSPTKITPSSDQEKSSRGSIGVPVARPENLVVKHASTPKLYDVFISHVDEDSSQARELYNALQAENLTCWFDKVESAKGNLRNYTMDIPNAVAASSSLVLLVSKAANRPRNGVILECNMASERDVNIPIYPLFIEDVAKADLSNIKYFLSSPIQHLYAFSHPAAQPIQSIARQIKARVDEEKGIRPTDHQQEPAQLSATAVQEGENWYSIDEQPRVFSKKASDTTVNLLRALAKISSQMLPEMEKELNAQVSNRKVVKRRRIAQNKEALYNDSKMWEHSVEVIPGWWLGTNYSNGDKRDLLAVAAKVAAKFGVKVGFHLV